MKNVFHAIYGLVFETPIGELFLIGFLLVFLKRFL